MAANPGVDHGGMDITDQRQTFSGFIAASLWGGTLIIQSVALLVVAFAIGAGWWAGLAAFVAIGVAVGLLVKSSAAWWAVQIGLAVLMVIGGALIPLLAGLMS